MAAKGTVNKTAGVPNDKIAGGVVIIGGIFIMALLAGASKNVGKVMLVIMSGFLLVWLMTGGAAILQKWLGKIPGSGNTVKLI